MCSLLFFLRQTFQVYLRGSMIRFIILPDMLKKAPMFKRVQQVGIDVKLSLVIFLWFIAVKKE